MSTPTPIPPPSWCTIGARVIVNRGAGRGTDVVATVERITARTVKTSDGTIWTINPTRDHGRDGEPSYLTERGGRRGGVWSPTADITPADSEDGRRRLAALNRDRAITTLRRAGDRLASLHGSPHRPEASDVEDAERRIVAAVVALGLGVAVAREAAPELRAEGFTVPH